MTIEDTLAVILAELRTLNGRMAHIGGAVVPSAPEVLKAAKAKAQPAPKQPEPQPISKPLGADAPPPPPPGLPAATPTTTTTLVTYDQVKDAGLKLLRKGGREGVAKVFAPFGINNAQEAKPEIYPALLAALLEAAK